LSVPDTGASTEKGSPIEVVFSFRPVGAGTASSHR
jgi:hypothetical protein